MIQRTRYLYISVDNILTEVRYIILQKILQHIIACKSCMGFITYRFIYRRFRLHPAADDDDGATQRL